MTYTHVSKVGALGFGVRRTVFGQAMADAPLSAHRGARQGAPLGGARRVPVQICVLDCERMQSKAREQIDRILPIGWRWASYSMDHRQQCVLGCRNRFVLVQHVR